MSRRTIFQAALTLATLALALAGCGGDDTDNPALVAATTTSLAAAGTASTTSAAAGAPGQTTSAPAATTTTGAGPVFDISYRGGKIEGSGRKAVTKGQTVTLRVTADIVDEVHVHGYDKSVATIVSQTVELVFRADAAGIFEVELEKKHLKLAELEVR
jgi:FtsP/CotA-like multicopper oxidase with cupredoxin domain